MKLAASHDLDLLVDPDATPVDLDRFLDALDQLVERRLIQRSNQTTPVEPQELAE